MATASLAAFLWIALRPDALLVAFPFFVVTAPLSLGLMIVLFRRKTAETAVLLVPLVLLTVDFNLRSGAPGYPGAVDAQTFAKGVLYAVLTVHGLVALRRDSLPAGFSALFLAYALFAAASTLYADSKFLAAGGGLALVGTALAANTLSRLPSSHIVRMWRTAFLGLVAFAAISLALYIFLPGFAVATGVAGEGRLRGVTGAPNSLGPLMVIGVLIGLYVFAESGARRYKFAIALSLVVLLTALALTGSRTAIGGLGLALVTVAIAASSFFLWGALIGAVVLVWIISHPPLLYAAFRLLADLFARSGQVLELTTFTGRMEIWRFSLQKWAEAPWFGYGLGAPRWVNSEGWSNLSGGTTGTTHNMVLESLMSLGAVGTILLFVVVLTLLLKVVRYYRRTPLGTPQRRLAWLLVTLMIFILVDGLMEKSFAGLPSPQTIVLAMIAGTCLALLSNSRKDREAAR
jgi:O-antigen ligase